ncbi:hypothetical protein [Pseudooceanicola aestuarii]|uniref:FliH/SctL family protein n=1 Tax=Pseudooceanicola aestuarii TaxID=2697319 RepID=UPI0013D4F307|nr:hypothetical protein [Pseudooceanicola aestuarii]
MQFVFERSFDTDVQPANTPGSHRVDAIYTRAEFDAAVAEASRIGYDDGRTAGRAEAYTASSLSEAERQLATLEALPAVLETLFADADRHHAALESQLLHFVLSVFERLAPRIRASLAADEAEREAGAAIRMALGSATLRVFLPPETVKPTGDAVLKVAHLNGYGGRIDIAPDPELQTGDVRVSWDHGVMDYSFDAICQRVLDALSRSSAQARDQARQADDPARTGESE